MPLRVALVDVLEDRGAFLAVQLGRVGPRQAGVERVLDGQQQRGARRGLLSPVEHQRLLELHQQLVGHTNSRVTAEPSTV
jgi:hypothetical protein